MEIENTGETATSPRQIPKRGWWQIVKRIKDELAEDHVTIVAAGIAFYFFLAIFPALAALVSIYGLLVSPEDAASQIEEIAAVLPSEAGAMIGDMVGTLANKPDEKLGWGLVVSILVSLWSAKKGTGALFEGLNIAYEEKDNRGFIKKNLLTLSVTVALVIGGIIAISLVALVPAVIDLFPLPNAVASSLDFLRWPLVTGMIVVFLSWIYRVAPDRDSAEWKWLSVGSVMATGLWLAGSAGFSWYIDTFGSMDKTYGSFAAVVVLLLWLFLTSFIILLGAEINSELELQTSVDTTTGPDAPMGERGAYCADHVASKEAEAESSSGTG
ncbi:YihY/virulence factor BrkB family protein [Haloferula chungangensis]|uniref:YihY/virulence factor BrkB family protein n=1 Tax=Haloferula chungangensis TaxID=1048331 RepID=A0ABW2L7I7_9BACT